MTDLRVNSKQEPDHAKKILCVFRHGNTFDPGDVIRRVGITDLPLSPSGKAQVTQLAQTWTQTCRKNPQLWADQVYCSDRLRTQQTAQALLDEWATSKPEPRIIQHSLFNEIDYGADENKPESEVVARLGTAVLQDWENHNIPPPGWVIDPEVLQHQIREFIAGLPEGTTWIVTSNGIARFIGPALGLTRTQGWKLKTAHYGIFEEKYDSSLGQTRWACGRWGT